jgi:hypothetical protein
LRGARNQLRGARKNMATSSRDKPLGLAHALSKRMSGRSSLGHPEPEGDALITLPGGETVSVPVLRDAAGNRFLDIRKLYPRWVSFMLDLRLPLRPVLPLPEQQTANNKQNRPRARSTGLCTFDPGFGSTAACESAITYIDGGAGLLAYRGVPIEALAERGDFVDAAFLLLHGELPAADERRAFEREITMHSLVHESIITFYRGFR